MKYGIYDASNIAFLKTRFNITAKLFTLKYVPELNILPLLPKQDHDIDILYYGAFNDRRQIALNNIRTLMPDKNIITTDALWGDELNDAIRRSKLILNIHFFEQNSDIHSIVREFFISGFPLKFTTPSILLYNGT